MFRIRYFPIGAETLTPITSENIDQRGTPCVIDNKIEVANLARILASATTGEHGGHLFTDQAVRVKIVETSQDAGDRVMAIVENEGVVRRGGVDQVLSAGALADLKRRLEAACRFH